MLRFNIIDLYILLYCHGITEKNLVFFIIPCFRGIFMTIYYRTQVYLYLNHIPNHGNCPHKEN